MLIEDGDKCLFGLFSILPFLISTNGLDWVEEPTIVAPVKASFVTAPVQQALVSPGVDQYLEHGVQKITQLPIGRKVGIVMLSYRLFYGFV
tara:strand:- start:272 stop:544 length:273 start_codon:yes stop_codon:yes gene_type:complete